MIIVNNYGSCSVCNTNCDSNHYKKTRTNLRSHIEEAFDDTPEALEKILEADLDNDYVEDGIEIINHMEETFDEERTPIESRGHNELTNLQNKTYPNHRRDCRS